MMNVKLLRLKSGEDVIADVTLVDTEDTIILESAQQFTISHARFCTSKTKSTAASSPHTRRSLRRTRE